MFETEIYLNKTLKLIIDSINNSEIDESFSHQLKKYAIGFFSDDWCKFRILIPYYSSLLLIEEIPQNKNSEFINTIAIWALLNISADIFDKVQDSQGISFNYAIGFLGISRLIANQSINMTAIQQEIGTGMLVGAWAQEQELKKGFSKKYKSFAELEKLKEEYFVHITAKSAKIISIGCKLPAILLNCSLKEKTVLEDFGLLLGIIIQLCDDAVDIEEDISNDIYSLVILNCLQSIKSSKNENEFNRFIKLLEERRIDALLPIIKETNSDVSTRKMVQVLKAQSIELLRKNNLRVEIIQAMYKEYFSWDA